MTTDEYELSVDTEKFQANLKRLEELSQRLTGVLTAKKPGNPSLQGPGQDLYAKAASAFFSDMVTHPTKLFEHQISYWGKSLQAFAETQEHLGEVSSGENVAPADMWRNNPYFDFLKEQYRISAESIQEVVHDLEGLDEGDQHRLEYFSRQLVEMFSPANFLGTNPEALAKAMETEGQSLVDGLENLVRDLERNDGELMVTLADQKAFEVGKNLATTKGSVVFRNRLLELIQYAPTTEKVHAIPLVIFPPWINKFYILDLKEKNSLIKWLVDQGYTVFVASWANPDASYRDVSLGDYIEEGYLEAIRVAKEVTSQKKVNAVGYCIGGTTLALTTALLKKRKDKSINSATFFTTLTDFSDQGEFGVFLTDDFVDGIEEEVKDEGILKSFYMARTFSFLRSRDLIYGPAIRSYMMGEAPPAFDLLYWNGDGTNLPACMSIDYLRGLCQENRFANDGMEILGETLKLEAVDVPVCAIACETDHIAAWDGSYRGVQQMGSKDKTFLLSESGHIAGIINPPSKKKYGHYTNDEMGLSSEDWRDSATFHEGSWWPTWDKWLSSRSGARVSARDPGDSKYPELCPAPGTYVAAATKD